MFLSNSTCVDIYFFISIQPEYYNYLRESMQQLEQQHQHLNGGFSQSGYAGGCNFCSLVVLIHAKRKNPYRSKYQSVSTTTITAANTATNGLDFCYKVINISHTYLRSQGLQRTQQSVAMTSSTLGNTDNLQFANLNLISRSHGKSISLTYRLILTFSF